MAVGKRKLLFRLIRIVLVILLIAVLAVAALFLWLTLTEFKPAEHVPLEVSGNAGKTLKTDEPFQVVSWNTGYGCLGETADFFMDGGKGVKTADRELAQENLASMADTIKDLQADLVFLQEVDVDSARSSHIDETAFFASQMTDMASAFAANFKVPFLPYPLPPIGKVHSGIQTLSAFPITQAERVQLPCPFTWPVRIANLKRCLEINRIPVEGSDRQLVAVNLHLEAYDSGEGKILQTQMLRDILQAEADKGNYVIAGGDFNQTFSDADDSMYPPQEGKWHSGRLDVSEFSDEWQFLMDNSVPTCRSLDQPLAGADPDTFQYYLIDGFIVSSNVEILSCETQDLGFVHTDHNPVVIEVRLGD